MANATPISLLVVPCYREETRLPSTALLDFLPTAPHVHFLLVDDGSDDDTLSVLKGIAERCPAQVQVLALPKNVGKAEAVRQGILLGLRSKPSFIGYWDADWATPLSSILLFEKALEDPAIEFVLGARVALLGRQISRNATRHYLGRVFATAASATLHQPIYDTQCGAKMLRVTARTHSLFAKSFCSRWIFDVELLARYLTMRGGNQGLYEYPLPQWTDVGESKVTKRDFLRSVGEMANIYRQYPLGQPLRPVVLLVTGVFSRYAIVGGMGTATHYGVLIVAIEALGLPVQTAAIAGASVGALVNYVLNYHLTFQSRASHRKAVPRFAVVAALGIVGSGFGVAAGAAWGLHYLFAQVVCTVLVLLVGFVVNRAWAFSH